MALRAYVVQTYVCLLRRCNASGKCSTYLYFHIKVDRIILCKKERGTQNPQGWVGSHHFPDRAFILSHMNNNNETKPIFSINSAS